MTAKRFPPIFCKACFIALREREANRCIFVRGRKPVFVSLCGAEELLHLVRRWRCWRRVRIEWQCELTEEAVELLLAHGDCGCRCGRSISERVPGISWYRNDVAGIHCLPARGRTLGLEDLKRTIQHIKYLRIGAAMKGNNNSCGHR